MKITFINLKGGHGYGGKHEVSSESHSFFSSIFNMRSESKLYHLPNVTKNSNNQTGGYGGSAGKVI